MPRSPSRPLPLHEYGGLDVDILVISHIAEELCPSLKRFPYSRLFSSRIPIPAHSLLFVLCPRNFIVTETIEEGLEEIGTKKKTSGYEPKKREAIRSSYNGVNST